jgi:hypothetical protein
MYDQKQINANVRHLLLFSELTFFALKIELELGDVLR